MLEVVPPIYRKRDRPARTPTASVAPPAPPALVLVAAEYEEAFAVTLVFDRAVDVSAIVLSAIRIDDGIKAGERFVGEGTVIVDSPTILRVPLVSVGVASGPDVLLSVTDANGIVAVDNGGRWPGCSELRLPFAG